MKTKQKRNSNCSPEPFGLILNLYIGNWDEEDGAFKERNNYLFKVKSVKRFKRQKNWKTGCWNKKNS